MTKLLIKSPTRLLINNTLSTKMNISTASSLLPHPQPFITLSSYTTLFRSPEVVDAPCPLRALSGEPRPRSVRSEEHTSELQSQSNIVCRVLLEKKNKSQTHV